MELEIYKMLYKKENDDNYNLRILGNIFVKNNKGKGKLIINNKKQTIKEFKMLNLLILIKSKSKYY